MSKKARTAFFDVDTQRDFMVPSGALYVPGARMVSGSIRRLVAHAALREQWLFASVDAHTPDDPEFDGFPPHCVAGTRGQEKIRGTLLRDRATVPSAPRLSQKDIQALLEHGQIIFEKQSYDVFDNPNTVPVLRASGASRFIVFGVATDYCVRAAALGLRKLGFSVTVVKDAIRGITDQGVGKALDEMRRAGIRFRTTEQVIA